jgi:hypothetical protein
MSKKVVELRKIASDLGLPMPHKLRTKSDLCKAIELHEASTKEQEVEEEEEEEVNEALDKDDEDDDDESIHSYVAPTFSFPSLDHATDEFHWQKGAVASRQNGYATLNVQEGSTFWHGTSLLFPDGRMPFGISFYGDIDTARGYAEKRGKSDRHQFARILSVVCVKPLSILKMSHAPNVIRLRKRLDDDQDLRPFVPLLDYAFPLRVLADGNKHLTRYSNSTHDAALNFGVQSALRRLMMNGWCAVEMKQQSEDEEAFHDEICFKHDSSRPFLERGPDQMFLMPRYPHTLLHFHNGAFCGFIDTRNTDKARKSLQICDDIDYTELPKSVRNVPEIAFAIEHRAQFDLAYMSLADASKVSAAKPNKPRPDAIHPPPRQQSRVPFMSEDISPKSQLPSPARHNPLGLPPPTGGSLIDRSEFIPKSFAPHKNRS